MAQMVRPIGKLPPRYAFALNPLSDFAFSRCPQCKKTMHLRKFALFIHVEGWGPLSLRKTSRYCTQCELIIVRQKDLEEELCVFFDQHSPTLIGNDYFVLGTLPIKAWKEGLDGMKFNIEQILAHVSDFKKHLELKVARGGWRYEKTSY